MHFWAMLSKTKNVRPVFVVLNTFNFFSKGAQDKKGTRTIQNQGGQGKEHALTILNTQTYRWMDMDWNRRQLLRALSSSGLVLTLPSLSCLGKDYVGERWWLEGGYAPVFDEVDLQNLRVEGEIPKELNGMYVRNGGNPRADAAHYFIGDGMLHGIWLENGQAVRYRNRWVQTSLLKDNKSPSLNKTDNMSNTSIVYYGGRLLSLMEIGFPFLTIFSRVFM